jgi:hypothetical protein
MAKKVSLLVTTLLLLAATLCAAQGTQTYSADRPEAVTVTTQKFTTGWDKFNEPLNLTSSNVNWSVSQARKMTVTFSLVSATPDKLYQVGVHIFCTNADGTFGQFPTNPVSGPCDSLTRQGKTATVEAVEMGVVTTDRHGRGFFLEFTVRDGAGCNLIGGAGNGSDCAIDFQSPGPFTNATTVVVP